MTFHQGHRYSGTSSLVALSKSDLGQFKSSLADAFIQPRVTPGIPVRDEFLIIMIRFLLF